MFAMGAPRGGRKAYRTVSIAQETNALPSVYAAGNELPIFTVGDLTFGIFICYESKYYYSPRYSAGFQLRRRDA